MANAATTQQRLVLSGDLADAINGSDRLFNNGTFGQERHVRAGPGRCRRADADQQPFPGERSADVPSRWGPQG